MGVILGQLTIDWKHVNNDYLINDEIYECVPEGSRHVYVYRVVMELMAGPEYVDLVQRPVHPIVDEFHQQQR